MMEYEQEFIKFMGNFYNNPPKPTFKELKEKYEDRLKRKNLLEKHNAPKIMIDTEEKNIVHLYNKMKKRDYGSYSDPSYKKYREAYEAREQAWFESNIRKVFPEKGEE